MCLSRQRIAVAIVFTFVLVPPLLLVLATLACYVPARRATRLDPTVALRAE